MSLTCSFSHTSGYLGHKTGRSFANPADEFCQTGVRSQRVDCVEVARKLGFGECRVDFPMADVVQQNCWPSLATFQFGDEVVQALLHIRRDRAIAEGTNRV